MTKEEIVKFCEYYVRFRGNETLAAKALNIDYINYRLSFQRSKELRMRVEIAKAQLNNMLEAHAFKIAHDGWLEPVYSQGTLMPEGKRRYADKVLIFLMQNRMPEKYGKAVGQVHEDDLEKKAKKLTQLISAAQGTVPMGRMGLSDLNGDSNGNGVH